MRRVAYVILVIIGIFLLIMPLSVPRFKSDAPYSVLNTGPEGTSRFGALLYHSGEVIPVLFPYSGSGLSSKNGTLVVIAPNVDFSNREVEVLRSFISSGGTLLLADDFNGGNSLLAALNVSARLSQEPAVSVTYSSSSAYPMTRAISPALLRGASYVVFHRPAVILNAQNPLAFTSNATLFNGAYGAFPIIDEIRYGRGRIILVSDPDIFVNALFKENEPFLRDLVAYLPGKVFYIDEAHHRDLNPYSSGTVVIQHTVSREGVFYYVLFVALVAFFVESGLASRLLFATLGFALAVLERLFGTEGEGLEDVIKRLEARGYDGDKLKKLVEEIETGSKLGGAHGR